MTKINITDIFFYKKKIVTFDFVFLLCCMQNFDKSCQQDEINILFSC